MKLIVGLGNPGEKYAKNRHNVGFMVVEELARIILKSQILEFSNNKKFSSEMFQTKDFILAKPQTFMNESGVAVATLCNFYKIKNEDLYIIHDDLDIKLGEYKIQFGKGPKVHNGLRSVEEKIGSDQFWNVRVGVDNREIKGNKGIPGMVYSLQDFAGEEHVLVEGVIGKVSKELSDILQGLTS